MALPWPLEVNTRAQSRLPFVLSFTTEASAVPLGVCGPGPGAKVAWPLHDLVTEALPGPAAARAPSTYGLSHTTSPWAPRFVSRHSPTTLSKLIWLKE